MCGDLALAFGVALARVRFPQAGRGAPSTSASLALRAALGPRGARPLRLRWSSRSLTLAATVPNVFNEVIACACLALEAPQPFWPDTVLQQHPHRRRCAPRLRTCRVRPLRHHRSPCSLTLAATVPGGSLPNSKGVPEPGTAPRSGSPVQPSRRQCAAARCSGFAGRRDRCRPRRP